LHRPNVLTTRPAASWWRLGPKWTDAALEGIPSSWSASAWRWAAARARGTRAERTGTAALAWLAPLAGSPRAGRATGSRGLILRGVNKDPLVVVAAPVVKANGLVFAFAPPTDDPGTTTPGRRG